MLVLQVGWRGGGRPYSTICMRLCIFGFCTLGSFCFHFCLIRTRSAPWGRWWMPRVGRWGGGAQEPGKGGEMWWVIRFFFFLLFLLFLGPGGWKWVLGGVWNPPNPHSIGSSTPCPVPFPRSCKPTSWWWTTSWTTVRPPQAMAPWRHSSEEPHQAELCRGAEWVIAVRIKLAFICRNPYKVRWYYT